MFKFRNRSYHISPCHLPPCDLCIFKSGSPDGSSLTCRAPAGIEWITKWKGHGIAFGAVLNCGAMVGMFSLLTVIAGGKESLHGERMHRMTPFSCGWSCGTRTTIGTTLHVDVHFASRPCLGRRCCWSHLGSSNLSSAACEMFFAMSVAHVRVTMFFALLRCLLIV